MDTLKKNLTFTELSKTVEIRSFPLFFESLIMQTTLKGTLYVQNGKSCKLVWMLQNFFQFFYAKLTLFDFHSSFKRCIKIQKSIFPFGANYLQSVFWTYNFAKKYWISMKILSPKYRL